MTPDQLRKALAELKGERDATFAIVGMPEGSACLTVPHAMLVPDEPDHLVKVTDGRSIYILDAERIAWIRISLKHVT
ncbi:MAG: hypothetical protein H6811_01670 [Phycisphaeraceae bacterium]|nr:hypothetical protein [Phycisphaeraceae bacterium]